MAHHRRQIARAAVDQTDGNMLPFPARPVVSASCKQPMINAVGLIVILGCVFGSFILSGGKLGVIVEALPHELMAIVGASVGAFLLGNSLRTVKLAGSGLKRAFKGPRWTAQLYRELLTLLFGLFTTFKKQGATGIEPHLDAPAESPIFARYPKILADHHLIEFICDYLRMMTVSFDDPHQQSVAHRRLAAAFGAGQVDPIHYRRASDRPRRAPTIGLIRLSGASRGAAKCDQAAS